ncbi:MAG: D-alanine--D-alanine ligase [Desulfobulbaceae bacterium]|nr:MAG: D-alanine--D-alanine ligase [Desulfobulbaceae bacterium]
MQQQKMRVALLAGGTSGEREVSLNGAAEVERSLDPERFQVRRYDPATDLARLVNDATEIDFAFILLHGLQGEDGTVQGLLELLGIPYQGSGVLGSAIAMDKDLSKVLFRQYGLPVADSIVIRPSEPFSPGEIVDQLGLPLVVKPVREGSSLGLTIARTPAELQAGIDSAKKHDRLVMIEQYIKGREITAAVLGNDELTALPLIEIIPGEGFEFFDYTAKYQAGASKEICPAPLSPEQTATAQKLALEAHSALRLRGYSRTDMILDAAGNFFLLESNTIPGMTSTSLLPQAAAQYGLSFPQFLDRLIALAFEDRKSQG